MSEEKHSVTPDTSPEAPKEVPEVPERPAPKPRTSSQQRKRRNSVFQYIAILFAAAFVLLLFTFVMERRQHELLQEENQEQINNLQQSVTAVQSLQNLYDENDALKEQVEELEDQIDQLRDEINNLEDLSASLSDQLAKTSAAMDWFWQIDEAYTKGRYSLCRSLIQNLENAGLTEYLPKESATANDRFSPYDRYQEIYDKLY